MNTRRNKVMHSPPPEHEGSDNSDEVATEATVDQRASDHVTETTPQHVSPKPSTSSPGDRELAVLRAKMKLAYRQLMQLQPDITNNKLPPATARVHLRTLQELQGTHGRIMQHIIDLLPDDLEVDMDADDAFRKIHTTCTAILEAQLDETPTTSEAPVTSAAHHLSVPMPTFDGRYEEWPKFKAMFLDIMGRTPVSDAAKLHHLNKALTGKAAGIINAAMVSSNNYKSAWEVLERRFANPRAIVDKHIAGLLQLKPVQRESANELRSLVETCKGHVDGLQFLEKNIDETSNLIITHILASCMDPSTRKAWELTLQHGEFPDLFRTFDYITRQCEVLESCAAGNMDKPSRPKPAPTKAFTSTVTPSPTATCVMCQDNHMLSKCADFIALSLPDKRDKLRSWKRCFNCFGAGHLNKRCPSKWTCRRCQQKHHTLLHDEGTSAASEIRHEQPTSAAEHRTATISLHTAIPSTVLLSTVMLYITDSAGKNHAARALLDSGAQSNFITGRLAQFLNLPRKSVSIPLSGIGGSQATNVKSSVRATIQSRCSSFSTSLEMLVLPKLSADVPAHRIHHSQWTIPATCVLADPTFHKPGGIDIILGAACFYELLKTGRISLGEGMPSLQETAFGWVVSGTAQIAEQSLPVVCSVAIHTNELTTMMRKFFAIEDVGSFPSWSIEERACEDHYAATTSRDQAGRYVVRLPRKSDMIGKLGDSRTIALHRFLAIERRMQREPETKKAYVEFMAEYLRLGHMTKVAATVDSRETFYLPHHPVFKADSTTTKCRVVFDASSKSSTGVSLNDTLMIGPTIQQDATSILMRFRTHQIALTGDVAKMYRQVWVHPSDRALQRILWRASPHDPIEEYELNTITYGTASAPFLAVRSLQQTVLDHGSEFPIAAARFADFYVDDFVSGADSPEAAQTLQQQTEQLFAKGGFELRKWASNEEAVLHHVDQQSRASSPYPNDDDDGSLATLGIIWDTSADTLRFKVQAPDVNKDATKRKVLSTIGKIYDPVGFVDPVKAVAKQLLQRVWTLKHVNQQPWGWDAELPLQLRTEWLNFLEQMHYLHNISIPRVAIRSSVTTIQYHVFCDASEKGYGACCYIRSGDAQGHGTMELFASKTKVTPLNSKHSIARLELCAAQLASLLFDRVRTAVNPGSLAVFWTDSMTVVHWLRASPNSWKPYVANRVSQVQQLTEGCTWRHIAGVDNPADLASRGCLGKDLLSSTLWWQGPSWMSLPEDQWPPPLLATPDPSVQAEQRVAVVACAAIELPVHRIFTLFSSYSKLRRMTAYWVQYWNRCTKRRSYENPGLTTKDLTDAEEVLCRLAQRDHLQQEIKALQQKKPVPASSPLRWLHPQLGADGIIRVGGRLSNSPLAEDVKHPLVVPASHPFARLLMEHFHKQLLHAGPTLMLNTCRQRFWITSGRNLARKVFHQCHTCFRARPSSSATIMADLPAVRVTPAPPFSITGVDYCGPVFLKGGHRRAAPVKAYVAIFVCFTTRAVHIELVSNLTTEAFIAALRRFVSRRGLPLELHSDNATNFKGAANKLNELYKLLRTTEHQQSIQAWTLERKISWKFIPPRAPHFGGLWEAAVKTMKYHLVRVLGTTSLSYEDMSTLLDEIECCVNSRPITSMSDDPHDMTALTPGHFLVGTNLQLVPDHCLLYEAENRLNHWRHVQQLRQHFWNRWQKEYLQQLQARSKWTKEGTTTVTAGTLVIIKEDNVPSACWPLARVTEEHPGKDGKARVFTLRTSVVGVGVCT
ncbi:uncharacterized protein LOC131292773 [Anopheles ziemanni]|uniref:uncharacterized protein LOC131271124 n=1 Tax=Anopheles coustani TaxID=139045 RepID=UPI002657E9A9|nr:uncharacterized protein LOC131271124 [Anopheles coustani]XP_058176839.1 uncharacterized protein LOC131292773 [Anopheles ziemanni]